MHFDLTMVAPSTIRGRLVIPATYPGKMGSVEATCSSKGGFRGLSVLGDMDVSGRFTLANLEPGDYHFWWNSNNGYVTDLAPSQITIMPGSNTNVTLRVKSAP